MIRTDKEYQGALERLQQDTDIMEQQRRQMKKMGLNSQDIEIALQPSVSFHEQLKDEVQWYERVKNGDFEPINNIEELGYLLIGLRLFFSLSQKQLADLLGVSEAQVSRDERNEYHGITKERAQRIFEALKAQVEIRVTLPEKELVPHAN